MFAVTDGLAGRERGADDRLDQRAAGDLDDHIDVGSRDQRQRIHADWDARGQRSAIAGDIQHRNPRDPEPHAIAFADCRMLTREHVEQPAPHRAAADEADADLSHRFLADTMEAGKHGRARRCHQTRVRRGANRQAFLVRQERVVAYSDSSFHNDDCAPAACSSRCSSS